MANTTSDQKHAGRPPSNVLREKIRKARLRVTLDEELGRTTPEKVKKLAAFDLPPLVREPRENESPRDRRTSDSQSDGPARGTSDRALLSNELRMKIRKAQLRVTLDEQLGRTTPESAKKLAALPLPPLIRVPRKDENAADRRTSDSESDGPTHSPSDRALLSNALRMKILKAQLRVTLDEQLGRTTPERAKKLAALPLPTRFRVPRQDGRAAERRPTDPQNDAPARRKSDRALLNHALRQKILKARLRVTLDEQLGRTTPESAKKLAALDLPPFVRVPRQNESAEDRRACDPQNGDPMVGASRREILRARLKVSLNGLLGRDTPQQTMRLSRTKLVSIMRGQHASDDTGRWES